MWDLLGVRVDALDEIGCLVKGLGFLMVHVPSEAYTFAKAHGVGAQAGPQSISTAGAASQDVVDRPMEGVTYPYLLVNVGSGERRGVAGLVAPAHAPGPALPAGVGFIVVRSESDWERVSGTSLGGGTYYGLCHMLTGMTSFDEMLNQAESGDNERVDLTVGDIYGEERAVVCARPEGVTCFYLNAHRWGLLEVWPQVFDHRSVSAQSSWRRIPRA